jgi:hypothetical protein
MATRINMSSKKTICLVIASLVCIFIVGCNSSNRHVWILPNGEKIEYHEGLNDRGFTANIPEYINWTSKKRGSNSVSLGYNGGYKSFTLHLNQSQTLAWITGLDAGQTKSNYVAILDIANFKIVDGDCMWESESNVNSSDIKLKHEVERSSATANVIEEQK